MENSKLFIDGKWVEGSTYIQTYDPSNGMEFGKIVQSSVREVNRAVEAATHAFFKWSRLSVESRSQYLARVVEILITEYGEASKNTFLKSLIMNEMGKRLPEADIEVIESSDMANFFVQNASKLLKSKEITLNSELWPNKRSRVELEPIGVVGIIKPWNYPLELPIWSICPALLAGNTVVFKPSEYSTFVGQELTRIFEKAELPKGVFNLITGNGEVGEILVQHPNVKKISFTGSVQAGKSIAINCAKQLKRCSLELGGNDCALVLQDADIELTVNGLIWGAFCNSGQVCVGIKMAFIHDSIYEQVKKRLIDQTSQLRREIDYGPIISEKHCLQIDSLVKDALTKGAVILSGGQLANFRGNWYPPTIIENIHPNMRIRTEECFGPLLPIAPYSNLKEVIGIINSSQYGLGASIWTQNHFKVEEISKTLDVGMVWHNDVNVAYPEAPWCGRKNSGIGIDLSEDAIYEYVLRKHVNQDYSNDKRRIWWYPY